MKLKHESDVTVAEVRQFAAAHFQHLHAIIFHYPRVGTVESAHDLQECGLAGTALAHNLALVDRERHIAKHMQLPIIFIYAFNFNHNLSRKRVLPTAIASFHGGEKWQWSSKITVIR